LDKDRIDGSAKQIRGAIRRFFGRLLGDRKMRIDGCRVALNWALPQSVWRGYPETGKFRRDSCDFEEALVARWRCFGPKRRAK
jgi:hypothetical protein